MTFNRMMTTAALAALAVACSDGTGPNGNRTVSLSFTTGFGGGAQFSRTGMLDDTLVTNGDTLIITSAQIVLRNIELKRVDDDGCESLGMDDDDGCEEFSTGPMIVTLPLNGGVATAITIAPDTGSYDEVEFEVHKPESGGDDDAILNANPDFDGVSIRVRGSFNGVAFTFESDLDVEQENKLPKPIVVSETTTSTNVTMSVNLDAWFRTAGGSLIDPGTANKGGQNESVVKENIKVSFRAFEDHDRDGDDSDES
jgi:hypothetical protein